ncbi:MAG: flagellar biosynthesis repressor FlbT [Candidatus Pacebacteria bacterium]|nr:flagellar biosynthesis repressor FlbT [Candidatus Paceibacterota bacterium]
MALKLHLRAQERFVVNGAVITVLKPTTLIINNMVSMLLEKQIMHPNKAVTPARRIYYAVQCVYMAEEHERQHFLDNFESLVSEYETITVLVPVRDMLKQIREQLAAKQYYEALKSCNALIEHEDWLLSLSKPPEVADSV